MFLQASGATGARVRPRVKSIRKLENEESQLHPEVRLHVVHLLVVRLGTILAVHQ